MGILDYIRDQITGRENDGGLSATPPSRRERWDHEMLNLSDLSLENLAPTPSPQIPERFEAGSNPPGSGRDWSRPLELIREASEVIQANKERAAELEKEIEEWTARFRSELDEAEARITATDQRTDAAETRIREAESRLLEAEEWSDRFHSTLTEGFSVHLSKRRNRREVQSP